MNVQLIAAALIAIIFASAGAWINGSRWEVRYSGLVTEHAQAATDAATEGARKQLQLIQDMKGVNDALETAKADNERLANCVADGTCVVRVKAKCPSLPASGVAAPGTPEPAPELDPAARSDYFALLAGLDEQFAVLTKCQKYAEAMTPK